jgi:hypothetical protein
MTNQEIMERIEKLQKDITELESKTGKNRKKGTAFVIREKQDMIQQYKKLFK